ncbi:MAG: hypothetical protein EB150_09855, partial [Nitrososphaeria archaeon]|nr:hypothetical protein [Nitrososphaeria archaeon]
MKTTKNIIEELGHLVPVKNKHTVTEARAMHVISSAINLIELINRHYSTEKAEILERKLLSAIKGKDTA